MSVLCSCALQTATTQFFILLGRGLHHRDLLAFSFPPIIAGLVGACLAHGIAARPLHELPVSCPGTAHGLWAVYVREICIPETPLNPPGSFNQPRLLLRVHPYPQWDPSSSWFWTEEYEGGCTVGPQGSSSLSSEARMEGELPGFSSLPRKTSLVFQWPAYYVGQHQMEKKNNFKSRRNPSWIFHTAVLSRKAKNVFLEEVAGSTACPFTYPGQSSWRGEALRL